MTAARTGRKQPSIRTLWAIAKSPELHLTDEDLHAVVYRETGKESMKMLTQGEVNTVARVLQKHEGQCESERAGQAHGHGRRHPHHRSAPEDLRAHRGAGLE